MDVVPTPDLDKWHEDPFKGIIKNGFIWGRGAIDDKHMLMAWMETLELLLKEGFKP
jgi:carboxypeptidase PM20D1